MVNMNYGKEISEKFQREKLAELLARCNKEQQELFSRLYPNGPRSDQLAWAITQCHNTLIKNEKKV
jgi:3-methyladenine DNA glycosylase AlkC